jgi:hypothetical protein
MRRIAQPDGPSASAKGLQTRSERNFGKEHPMLLAMLGEGSSSLERIAILGCTSRKISAIGFSLAQPYKT